MLYPQARVDEASKNITIAEDAYETLISLKEKKGFNDVLKRLTRLRGGDPAAAVGLFDAES